MKREIKFAAWIKSEKKMIIVEQIHFDSFGGFEISSGDYEALDHLEVELMQFTGLTDKNDKNICIYEGDIISLQGNLIGNKYENEYLLEDKTNLLIEGFGTKDWSATEQKGLARGLQYSE